MEAHRVRARSSGPASPAAPLRTVWTAALLALSSCIVLPAVRGTFTPEELLQNAAALVGWTVTVRGKVDIVSGMCTEQACGGDNPCCNYCSYSLGFAIDKFRKIYFSGEAAVCTGDDCGADCPLLEPGAAYEVTGRIWKDWGDIYYLELAEWELIDPAPPAGITDTVPRSTSAD